MIQVHFPSSKYSLTQFIAITAYNGQIYASLNYCMRSDAAQLVFSMHCCLHLVGQPVSVGRLDQLLISYYERDISNGTLTEDKVMILLSYTMEILLQHNLLYCKL